jgi:hypothetical protein
MVRLSRFHKRRAEVATDTKNNEGTPGVKPEGVKPEVKSDTALLRDDALVARLIRDPANPPDLMLLWGFVGASSEADHVRLYLDILFSSYIDIPRDVIVHREPMPQAQSPLGGSYVWILKTGWGRLRQGNTQWRAWQQQMGFMGATPTPR